MQAVTDAKKTRPPARADARACDVCGYIHDAEHAAPLLSLPPLWVQISHLLHRQSRDAWKRLPLDGLPPHAGPRLVFDLFGEPVTWVDDWSGRTLSARIEIDEIIADQRKYARTGDGPARAKLAKRIRRRWWGLVDHAIGYRLPDDTLHIFEFAS